jgi:alkylated DNA repair dioxygenase AlkB
VAALRVAMADQLSMFAEPAPALPEGFRYRAELITPDAERALVERIAALPFRALEFQGYVGNRRTVSFGWHYDFADRVLRRTDDMPAFLLPLRATAAAFAQVPPERLQHALVTEYSAGAAIGWHRDKAVFGESRARST